MFGVFDSTSHVGVRFRWRVYLYFFACVSFRLEHRRRLIVLIGCALAFRMQFGVFWADAILCRVSSDCCVSVHAFGDGNGLRPFFHLW